MVGNVTQRTVHEAGHAVALYVFTKRRNERYPESHYHYPLRWAMVRSSDDPGNQGGCDAPCGPFSRADDRKCSKEGPLPLERPPTGEHERWEAEWRITVAIAGPIALTHQERAAVSEWPRSVGAFMDKEREVYPLLGDLHPDDADARQRLLQQCEGEAAEIVESWGNAIAAVACELSDNLDSKVEGRRIREIIEGCDNPGP